MINPQVVAKFKEDLWKDQRRLATSTNGGRQVLIKHYESQEEAQCEQQVIAHLTNILGPDAVPELLATKKTVSELRYFKGIRIFNLLVELDSAPANLAEIAGQIKRQIVSRCAAKERAIQKALVSLPDVRKKPPYPLQKVGSIIEILGDCLGIKWNRSAIESELNWLKEYWKDNVVVPFRDATAKNMILASPDLYLGNFAGSEDSRRAFIYAGLHDNRFADWMKCPIVDYDFGSCRHNTTPEDDVISIRFHERTWLGPPSSKEDLVWDFPADAVRGAVTFLVRYYRFGGRKAAYRLINSSGHQIRFRHDDDAFYFERLPGLMRTLWPEAVTRLPAILEFTEVLGRRLPLTQPDVDYFRSSRPLEKRDYYVDVYPE